MSLLILSTGFFEFTATSAVLVIVSMAAAVIALVGGSLRFTFKKLTVEVGAEGLLSKVLTVKRKDSAKTVTLPEHYTPGATQELLDLLAQPQHGRQQYADQH
jgi:hypothetical protein